MTNIKETNMFETIYRCPVCRDIIDVHKHPHREENGLAAAMLASDGRRLHAKEYPQCTLHPNWIRGWITDETVELVSD